MWIFLKGFIPTPSFFTVGIGAQTKHLITLQNFPVYSYIGHQMHFPNSLSGDITENCIYYNSYTYQNLQHRH